MKHQATINTHTLTSHYQAGPTSVRVLLPDRVVPADRHRVIYVLPVEPGNGSRYGDGLAEVQRLDLHNRYELICVTPTFSDWPWYADHPGDTGKQQESYFLQDVLPLIESTYPVKSERSGRLLLGFSKSGWGAWSLLLRHPEQFERAAAFDAPLCMEWPTKYESAPIFGDEANFQAYRIRSLLEQRAALLGESLAPRLMLLGRGNFQSEHDEILNLLRALRVPHRASADDPVREHTWSSGWMADAVGFLAGE